MAYKKVDVNDIPVWNASVQGEWQLKDNDEIEGIYRGVKEDVGDNHSRLYTIEANRNDHQGMYKVWGSVVLDDRMDSAKIGNQIKLVYLGKIKSEKGGRSYHNYELYIDVDAEIEESDEKLPKMEE